MNSITFKECVFEEEIKSHNPRNKEYVQIIDRILNEGLGRFDCLKISFDTRKKAMNAKSNFSALKKMARPKIGKFLSKNNVLILQRDANVYFRALGGIKVKPDQCL